MTELSPEEELPEIALPDDIAEEVAATEAEEVSDAAEEVLPKIQLEPEAETEDAKPEEKLPEIAEPDLDEDNIGERKPITHLSKEQKAIFTYFVPVSGMEPQICQAMEGSIEHLEKGIKGGNILIQGARGSGKTVLATALVKAIQNEIGKPGKRVGKIDAVSLNQKNIPELLKKVAGGCLIIEKIGGISRETAVKLSLALEADDTGILVIAEDTREGITKAMGRDESFARRFTEKITLPIFTSDELVSFAKSYAHELTYEIDEMAVLALYNRISNIQRLDRATTLTEVKEIVDEAIANSEKFSIKKVFFSKKYKDDDYVILHEKDFEE